MPEPGIGTELADKARMVKLGQDAAKGDPKPAPTAPYQASPADKIKPAAKYGDKGAEKRLDTSDWTKPLAGQKPAVYHKGVKVVPKTGAAILEKGEKVISKEENPDNPDNKPNMTEVDSMTSEHSPSEKAHFHRAMSHLHKGGLHRALGIPEGQKIPIEKKQAASNSDNKHTAAMGMLAVAMHGWK